MRELYASVDVLQAHIDTWLVHYNTAPPHARISAIATWADNPPKP